MIVSPGKRVRVGDPRVSLFDTDGLMLRAQLPARHLPLVRADDLPVGAEVVTTQLPNALDGLLVSVAERG